MIVFGKFPAGASTLPGLARQVGLMAPSLHALTGDGVASVFTVLHDRRTRDLTVMVRLDEAPWSMIVPDGVEFTTMDSITLTFGAPLALAARYVVKLSPV